MFASHINTHMHLESLQVKNFKYFKNSKDSKIAESQYVELHQRILLDKKFNFDNYFFVISTKSFDKTTVFETLFNYNPLKMESTICA